MVERIMLLIDVWMPGPFRGIWHLVTRQYMDFLTAALLIGLLWLVVAGMKRLRRSE